MPVVFYGIIIYMDSLSLYLSIYPSIHPSLYLSISLSLCLSMYVRTYVYVFVCWCVGLGHKLTKCGEPFLKHSTCNSTYDL